MLQKTVKIGDKEVAFRSSATIPRLYRIKLSAAFTGNTWKGPAFCRSSEAWKQTASRTELATRNGMRATFSRY